MPRPMSRVNARQGIEDSSALHLKHAVNQCIIKY